MKVSLNTVKKYIDFDLPPIDELVDKINTQLGGVDEVIDLGSRYKDAKIVRVVECERHPNADRLSVCLVDTGAGKPTQIVCGANNVHAGMWAVWLPPGSVVPNTFGSEDEFKLEARELRGEMSSGMLASARELGIGDDHDGIVDISENDTPLGIVLEPGLSFSEVFGLDDYIIDIENKMFTHRPDLFGQLGVAREIAGIFGKKFKSPNWYLESPEFSNSNGLQLEVFNDSPENVPRFMAVAMRDVEVKPSPLWMQIELMRLGSKAINNIVDFTNYTMLLTAQPTHAYDYDKLRGYKIGSRMAREGEKVTLINGKEYELSSDDIVIADAEGPIGLGGIMGGFESEVTEKTKNIVLEVATFDMYAVRRSGMRHGIFTDALTRFNKGQSPLQNSQALGLLLEGIRHISSAEQGSEVYDYGTLKGGKSDISVTVSADFIGERLGLNLNGDGIRKLLENVEMEVASNEESLIVSPPFWRTDIDLPEDIVEEVGRLYGFNKIPRQLPVKSIAPAPVNQHRSLKSRLRSLLVAAGANEVLTYSFVHENIIAGARQNPKNSYRLTNSLSPDLQYYRQSLTPSLLSLVHPNIKSGFDKFALFEFNDIHDKYSGLNEEGVPKEHSSFGFVFASSNKIFQGASYYQARSFLEFLAVRLGLSFQYEALGDSSTSPILMPFEPKRSAIITDKETGLYIGVVGEYGKVVQRCFKLPEVSAGFELDLKALLTALDGTKPSYRALSRYPRVERDISIKVSSELRYEAVYEYLCAALMSEDFDFKVMPLNIYKADGASTKNIAFRVQISPHSKTYSAIEIQGVMDDVAQKLANTIGSEIV